MAFPGTEEFLSNVGSLLLEQQPHGGTPLPEDTYAAVRNLFKRELPVHVGRAPARLDVMGGIADYSGALVLQLPLQDACFAAVQLQPTACDGTIHAVSLQGPGNARCFQIAVSALLDEGGGVLPYERAGQALKEGAGDAWAAYVVGCVVVAARELSLTLTGLSFRILVDSQVPEGKGVSSSAAVEVAVMSALLAALGKSGAVHGQQLAQMCQAVENRVVGAPCGIMDQMSSALGQAGKLLALLCQPAEVEGHVALPPHLAVWGVDSGVRHSVGGADYGAVRVGAFMGLRILQYAEAARKDRSSAHQAPRQHLAQLTPSEAVAWGAAAVPDQLTGRDFLQHYGPHLDSVTRVNQDQVYGVRQAALHPIYEHARVRTFRQLLLAPPSPEQCELLGELMLQSHESYSACGLGSPGTDRLVELVRHHIMAAQVSGVPPALYGAKITGGGSGGTVCILGASTPEADAAVQQLAGRYWSEAGLPGHPRIFQGSSDGAALFGHAIVRLVQGPDGREAINVQTHSAA